MASFMDRVKSSWNILNGKEVMRVGADDTRPSVEPSSTSRRVSYDTAKNILAPIVTRISIDTASIPLRHVLVDEEKRFKSVINSELNDRLTIAANIDQSGVAFIQDAVISMLVNGACALVPIETTASPMGAFEILSLRVGTVTQWYNKSVEVSIYNELTGDHTSIVLPKGYAAIAYNPMFSVMNEANSTLRRLIDRLSLLDVADGKLFSGQLDLIVQLPYTIKNERTKNEAARRIAMIEEQMIDRKYGVIYADAGEKITQLNRPVTNNLVENVVGLTESLHAQLGLTPAVFAGTATQEEMIQYYNRTIQPIITALSNSMIMTFFTRTAVRQGHSVMGFPNLFKMAPLTQFAEAADLLTRNEIISSNEARAAMGLSPSKDPEAEELRNKNLNKPVEEAPVEQPVEEVTDDNKE